MAMTKLEVEELRWVCDPTRFRVDSTEQLEDLAETVGQPRATS